MRRLPGQIWRALSQPRRTAHEAQVLADVLRFRRTAAPAWSAARPRRGAAGSTLIVSLSDNIYQLKLEGVLAKALQLSGFRPVVFTVRHARWAQPYLRGFGVEDFVYPDELAQPGDASEARLAVPNGPLNVRELKAVEFRGAKIGQQAISTLSRGMHRGRTTVLAQPEMRHEIEKTLRESAAAVLASERLLDRVDPDIVLFNEKGYAGYGSAYDVALARGKNVIQFVHAGIHWPDALLLKRFTEETRRMHPASLSPASWEIVRGLDWTEQRERELDEEFALRYGSGPKHPDAGLQEGKHIVGRDEVYRRLALDPAKKTAVVFSHILWDANLFYGEDLFDDLEEWFVETVRAACANPHLNWVVKLHPANRFKSPTGELNDLVAIRERVGELPPHVKLLMPETDINTYSFFGAIDYALTVRGTVGMETPCFGVRTLTAGTGRYSGLGFTDDSASRREYLEKLARLHELPPLSSEETGLGKRHAYGLFRLRPFRWTSYVSEFKPNENLLHPLVHNLHVTLQTPEEVERAPDLREFADWAERREQLDYLADPL